MENTQMEYRKSLAPADTKVGISITDLIDHATLGSAEALIAAGIKTDEEFIACGKLSDAIKDNSKKLEATRKLKTMPFNEVVDGINAWFKPWRLRLKEVEDGLNSIYVKYNNEREAKRREAQRLADEETARIAKAIEDAKAVIAAQAEETRKKAEREAAKAGKDSLFGEAPEVNVMAPSDEGGFSMEPVNSSNVESVGYDRAGMRLAVQFKNSKRYVFKQVPEKVYTTLRLAASVGKCFNETIKGRYEMEAINVVQAPAPAQPAAPTVAVPEPLKPAQTRKTWKVKIINPSTVPREFCTPSLPLLNAAVAKGARTIFGCEIYQEEDLVRSRS